MSLFTDQSLLRIADALETIADAMVSKDITGDTTLVEAICIAGRVKTEDIDNYYAQGEKA